MHHHIQQVVVLFQVIRAPALPNGSGPDLSRAVTVSSSSAVTEQRLAPAGIAADGVDAAPPKPEMPDDAMMDKDPSTGLFSLCVHVCVRLSVQPIMLAPLIRMTLT